MMDSHALDPIHDVYPGRYVTCLLPQPDGTLAAQNLTWDFDLEGKKNVVFNTRIETALDQLRRAVAASGRRPSSTAAASSQSAPSTSPTPPSA